MPKQISLELKDEDIEAYKELKQYVESKYGKIKGVIGEELAKAIRLYLQQLKASEGTPQSPQPQFAAVEKAKESKPIPSTKTTKELESKVEGLAKRVEDLEKELKATEETVKSLTKNVTDIGNKIDEYIKQRLTQVAKMMGEEAAKYVEQHIIQYVEQRIEKLKLTIEHDLGLGSIRLDVQGLKHDFKQLFHDCKATYEGLKKNLEELKKKLNEVINFINEKYGMYEGLFSSKKKPVIEPIQ